MAASQVGGGFQAGLFASLGFEPILAPTVLFGRHPGLGAPGGGPVTDAIFEGLLAGIAAAGAFAGLSAIITGYFVSAGQVAIATRAIEAIRAASPDVWVVVDPVMGDEGTGLYLHAGAARGLASDLVTRADLLAPNAWELARLSGLAVTDPKSALAAARRLRRPVLASSIDLGDAIGVAFVAGTEAWLASHRRYPNAPKGTGDLLVARYVAECLAGAAPPDALANAVAVVAEAVAGVPVEVRLEALS